jgi:hypothetical protein
MPSHAVARHGHIADCCALAQIGFQCGVLLAGVAAAGAARAPALALLACLAPCAFIRLMLGATCRLEERQLETYGEDSSYREWVYRVPRLLPLTLRRREESVLPRVEVAVGGGAAAGGADDADVTRATIAYEDEQKEINEGIANIINVTGLAAYTAAVIGIVGAALLF